MGASTHDDLDIGGLDIINAICEYNNASFYEFGKDFVII